ncbi:MAG: L-threonylcarbamoyladenylate synthase [Fuerstiella sp.]
MTAALVTQNLTDPSIAAGVLKSGQLVAFATETVYGLGADATNSKAVAKVFEAKKRPAFDPLIVHVTDATAAQQVASTWPPIAADLAAAFWPGPLTMVLPKRDHISDLVTSGLPGVGIRVPKHPLAQSLLQHFAGPVVAPSANLFGSISPTTAEHVRHGLSGRIAAVLDGGACDVGVESTVVSLMDTRPVILRPGGLAQEDIEQITGPIKIATANSHLDDSAQPAPGMLSRHYAPQTRLLLIDVEADAIPENDGRWGLLTHGTDFHSEQTATNQNGLATPSKNIQFQEIQSLGSTKDLPTCAANFFAGLRSLDAANLDAIIARKFPTHGLGIALNDRLKRAAAR